MKKILLISTALLSIFAFTACRQQEPPTLEPIFSTAESVNADISSLGEVTDIESAALVSKIIENYQFLDELSQSKITDIQRVIDSIETATTFFEKDDMILKVMSFNTRCGELSEDRMQRVIDTIRIENPDIIGIQEGVDMMCNRLRNALSDEYEMLGHGRDKDKTGENCNVMYKKDAFNLLESETLWLTDTPYIYSKHFESNCERILTYQLLERKSDGQIFIHVNTHLDHIGKNARIAQATMITTWLEDRFGGQYPVIITGDFNAPENTDEIQIFFNSGYEITNKDRITARTFNGYDESGAGGSLIDFCFINDMLPIVSYKVCDEKMDGEWISDHNAIVSEVLLLPAYDAVDIPVSEE